MWDERPKWIRTLFGKRAGRIHRRVPLASSRHCTHSFEHIDIVSFEQHGTSFMAQDGRFTGTRRASSSLRIMKRIFVALIEENSNIPGTTEDACGHDVAIWRCSSCLYVGAKLDIY